MITRYFVMRIVFIYVFQGFSLINSQIPSLEPSPISSIIPSSDATPTFLPAHVPSDITSFLSSTLPTTDPSCLPSTPSNLQSTIPNVLPSGNPFISQFTSSAPTKTLRPSRSRSPSTFFLTYLPTFVSTYSPTTSHPSCSPTVKPTRIPTISPSRRPSRIPTSLPTYKPTTCAPSHSPSFDPTSSPTYLPSEIPTNNPSTLDPSFSPTSDPSFAPSTSPSFFPTEFPSNQSSQRFRNFTSPVYNPLNSSLGAPTAFSTFNNLTIIPATLSAVPSMLPSDIPTVDPTSASPSAEPTLFPTSFHPTLEPSTFIPTITPSNAPTSSKPTFAPSLLQFYNPLPGYQPASPWSHFRGTDNLNNGRSAYIGSRVNKTRCFSTLDGIVYSSPVIAADGTIYIGTSGGTFYALTSTCSIKWRSGPFGQFDSNSAAVGVDGTVYIGSTDKNLYAFNPLNGSIVWKKQLLGEIHSSPILGNNGTIYIGDCAQVFYAFTSSGVPLWNFTTPTPNIRATPAISLDNKTIYVISYSTSDGSALYALDVSRPAKYGYVKWTTSIPSQVQASPAVGPDGTIYVGSFSFYLNALDPVAGSLKWRYQTSRSIQSSPSVGIDGTVYIGSNDGNVYALNPDSSVKWIFRTGGPVQSTALIDAEGVVYIGSNDNSFYAIDSKGSLKWRFATVGQVQSSAAISSDGTIYVGSADTRLYAINSPLPTLTPTPMPSTPTHQPSLIPTFIEPTYNPTTPNITTYMPTSIATFAPTSVVGGYQDAAYWAHYRGNSNLNTGLSSYTGPITNSIRCQLTLHGNITSTAVVAADGTIYIGTTGSFSGNSFYAFTSACSIKWRHSGLGAFDSSAAAIGSAGTIYAGSADRNLYAFHPDTGSILWKLTLNGEIHTSPAIGSDGTLYVAATDVNLYAVSPAGSVRWIFPLRESVFDGELPHSSQAITRKGMIIACGPISCYSINPFNPSNFTVLFKLRAGISTSPVIGNDDDVYVGGSDGSYNAFFASGKLHWNFPTNVINMLSTAAVDRQGNIYFGSQDTNVYAVRSDGALLWKTTIGHPIITSPTIDDRGVLYLGTLLSSGGANAAMYALNISTGKAYWKFDTEQPPSALFLADAVVGPANSLIAGTFNNMFLVFGESTLAPVPSPTFAPPTVAPTYIQFGTFKITQIINGAIADDFLSPSGRYVWALTVGQILSLSNTSVHIVSAVDVTTDTKPTVVPTSELVGVSHLMESPSSYPTTASSLNFRSSEVKPEFKSSSSLSSTHSLSTSHVSSYDSSQRFQVKDIAAQVAYTVLFSFPSTANQPAMTVNSYQKRMNESILSGLFTLTLHTNAVANLVPALTTATATQIPVYGDSFVLTGLPSTSPTQMPPTTPPVAPSSLGTSSLTNAAIIGISIGLATAGALICLLIGCLYTSYYLSKKGVEDSGSNIFGDLVRMSPRKGRSSHGSNLSQAFYEYDFDEVTQTWSVIRKRNFTSRSTSNSISKSHHVGQEEKIKLNVNGFKSKHNHNNISMVRIAKIQWSDLILDNDEDPLSCCIGKGSFGTVFRCSLRTENMADCAVKVLKPSGRTKEDEAMFRMAFEECRVMKEAENKMIHKDCIVKVYGMVDGVLPEHIAEAMNVQSAIGIVMRYEKGGTLTKRIHKPASRPSSMNMTASAPRGSDVSSADPATFEFMTMKEKVRIITGLARCLVELHSVGIVHGDIKPDNVLLSAENLDEAEVRLADFGLARMREEEDDVALDASSLNETKHTKGTLLYCAPEMMVNPYSKENVHTAAVAKASRKSDMYAFALVAWEILTGCKPFVEIKNETALAMVVHQGERPPLSKIPDDCPKKIVDIIVNCWELNRLNRESALKCYAKLQYEYSVLTNDYDDVCLSYHPSNYKICELYYQRLVQLGLKVCILNKEDIDKSNEQSLIMLMKSRIIVAFVNESYQADELCLEDLRSGRRAVPPKTPLVVFTEDKREEWVNSDITYLCQLRSQGQKTWDVSSLIHYSDHTDSNFDNSELGIQKDSIAYAIAAAAAEREAENDDLVYFKENGTILPFSDNNSSLGMSPSKQTLQNSKKDKSTHLHSSSHHSSHHSENGIGIGIGSQDLLAARHVRRLMNESKHTDDSEEIVGYNNAYNAYIEDLYTHIREILQRQLDKDMESQEDLLVRNASKASKEALMSYQNSNQSLQSETSTGRGTKSSLSKSVSTSFRKSSSQFAFGNKDNSKNLSKNNSKDSSNNLVRPWMRLNSVQENSPTDSRVRSNTSFSSKGSTRSSARAMFSSSKQPFSPTTLAPVTSSPVDSLKSVHFKGFKDNEKKNDNIDTDTDNRFVVEIMDDVRPDTL